MTPSSSALVPAATASPSAVAPVAPEVEPPPSAPSGASICEECGGVGEVAHPMWGWSTCPDPSITCPACQGRGETWGDAA